MRASQFIDFINRKKMPKNEEQLTHYTHIDLEDDKDEEGKTIKVNKLKKSRRKYKLNLKKGEQL